MESRRRPRSTSQSIIPLLTGASGREERPVIPRPIVTVHRDSEGSVRASVFPSAHPNHCPVSGHSEGLNAARKGKEIPNQVMRLPRR